MSDPLPPAPQTAPPLLEREDQLARLRRQVRGLAGGRGGVVVVRGAPGTGRSALLQHAVHEAYRLGPGVTTVVTTADPFEVTLDWAVASRIVAGLDGWGGPSEWVRLLAAPSAQVRRCLVSTLLAASATRPLLLVVDDLQWADALSAGLLASLAALAGTTALLVLVATDGTRPTFADAEADLLPEPPTVLRTHPLTAAAVARLVRRGTGLREAAVVEALRTAGAGSPAVLTKALTDLGTADSGPLPPASRLRVALTRAYEEQVGAVLDALPPEPAALLRAAAASDGVLTETVLRLLASPAGDTTRGGRAGDAAGILRRSGLLTVSGRPRPVDDVVRREALSGLPQAGRTALFDRAAELAHRAGEPDEAVARLMLCAAPTPSGWPVATLRRAAVSARHAGREDEAAALLRRALAEPLPADTRTAVLTELAAALARRAPVAADRILVGVILGEDATAAPAPVPPPTAGDDGRDGGQGDVPPGDGGVAAEGVQMRLLAANAVASRGDVVTARRVLRRRVAELRDDDSAAAVLEHETLVALHRLVLDMAPGPGEMPLEPLPDLPEDPSRAGVGAFSLAVAGRDITRVRLLARAALAAAAPPASPGTRRFRVPPIPRALAALALGMTNDLGEAAAGLDALVVDAQRAGDRVVLAHALVRRAMVSERSGRLGESEALLTEAYDALPPSGWDPLLRTLPLSLELAVHLQRGRWEDAERLIAAGLPARVENGYGWSHVLFHRGMLHLMRRRPREAARDLLECGRGLTSRGWVSPAVLPWRSLAAFALNATGQGTEALRLLAEEHRLAVAWGAATPVATTQVLRSLVLDDDRGDDPGPALLPADGPLRDSPARLQYAQVLFQLGERYRAGARPEQGGRAGAGRPAPGARGGAERGELSGAELRTVAMAAGGVTNAQIAARLGVTRRTVELHLTSVYRKLGVSGRADLARLFGPPTEED